jgi:hypothetical protein
MSVKFLILYVGNLLIEIDRHFMDTEPYSGQTKDYEIGICCFSAKTRSIKE